MPYADPVKRRESRNKSVAKWTAANKDRVRAYQREWRRKWRAANPEKNRAIKQRSYLKHRDKNLKRMRDAHRRAMADPTKRLEYRRQRKQWAEANPEKYRASIRNWHENNREYVRLWWKKHSALRRHRVGTFTADQWFARVAFYGWRCAYCECELMHKTLTIDHIIPIIQGGTNWASNLAPACRRCNVRKNRNRLLPLWLRRKES